MSEETAATPRHPWRHVAIVWGGLTVGFLDLAAASVNNAFRGRNPVWVLQSIAAGLMGPAAFRRGAGSTALGLALHFLIAFVVFTVYYVASREVSFLIDRAIVCGVSYGVAVYRFMYSIVLPLTFHRSFLQVPSSVILGLAIHVCCVGLPTALIVRRYSLS